MEEELCSILMRRFRGSLKLLMDVAYYIVCNITRFQMWVFEILVSMGKMCIPSLVRPPALKFCELSAEF